MDAFCVFKIVQMVSNLRKHHICFFLSHFMTPVSFYTPRKTSENQRFSDVFCVGGGGWGDVGWDQGHKMV